MEKNKKDETKIEEFADKESKKIYKDLDEEEYMFWE